MILKRYCLLDFCPNFFAYLPIPIPDSYAHVIDAPWISIASKLHDLSNITNSTIGPQT